MSHVLCFRCVNKLYLVQHPLLPVSVPIHTEASVYPLPRAIFRMFGNDDLQDFDGVSNLITKYIYTIEGFFI